MRLEEQHASHAVEQDPRMLMDAQIGKVQVPVLLHCDFKEAAEPKLRCQAATYVARQTSLAEVRGADNDEEGATPPVSEDVRMGTALRRVFEEGAGGGW